MTIETAAFGELTLPDLLSRPRAEVRALQDRLLRRTIALCHRGHPHYQRVMRERGLAPADVQTTDDLVKLPITSKQDFMADPEAFRLQLPDLPPEERILREVMYTTGTTSGRPAPIYTTTWDHYAFLFQAARCSDILGLRDTDVIANVFPLTPFPMGAYVRADAIAAANGAAIVTVNPGRPSPSFPVHRGLDEAVRTVERHRATIIWGVASFVRRMLIRANELGADFSCVRMCSITGEVTSKAMREDMRRRLADLGSTAARILNRYGSTEMIAGMLECVEGSGWHNPAPDQMFLEIVDPETGRRVGNGERGLVLMTHLIRRGTVLLRYAVGDVVAMTDEPCPHCGRTAERLVTQPARTGDLVKIKGMLVNLDLLQEELDAVRGLEEYQIVIQKSDPADPFSMDELVLRLAANDGAAQAVAREGAERTAAAAQVQPRLEIVRRDEIFDPTKSPKLQRIVDRRPTLQ